MGDNTAFKPADPLTLDTVMARLSLFYDTVIQDTSGKLFLDLSAVKHCDSAGLAWLIAVKKLCRKRNKTLEIQGMSEKIQALAEFCGIDLVDIEYVK
jgi:phospholipid transport system transporter-binding protein